ncbi:MAG: hypothetical protein ACJ74G_18105, partial [Blastocatellia bacterium]
AVRQRQAEAAAATDLALTVWAGQALGIELWVGLVHLAKQAIKLRDGQARKAEKVRRTFTELFDVEHDFVSMQ